jgi:hypothetical protein
LSVTALEALYTQLEPPFNLIYVLGGAPRSLERTLEQYSEKFGFRIVSRSYFLTPNESRNLGLSLATTKYIIFIENDAIPAPGWIEALQDCAVQTNADVIAPLICEGPPLHRTIHQAGGTFADDVNLFFSTPYGERRVVDAHTRHGSTVEQIDCAPSQTQTGEFHCVMVKREILQQLGGFDEKMMSTREHLDFAMSVHQLGGTIFLAPGAVVTFFPPWGGVGLKLSDLPYYMVRWSGRWGAASAEHFRHKWGIRPEQKHDEFVSQRYGEDIVRPLVRRMPFLGRYRRVGTAAALLMRPFLQLVGNLAAREADKRRSRAGVSRGISDQIGEASVQT